MTRRPRAAALIFVAAWAAAATACDEPGGPGAGDDVAIVGGSAELAIQAAIAPPFVPPADLAAWNARVADVRARVAASAGLTLPAVAPGEHETMFVAGAENAEAFVEEWLLPGFGGTHVPASLYLPRGGPAGPRPAVLINSGHDGAPGRRAPGVVLLARALVGRGFVVMTMDWWGMGSRFGVDARHRPLGARSFLVGLDPSTMTLGEPFMALAWLRARPEVDPARVAVAGQSGGGITSMHMAALDPGIAAAVVVDSVVPNTRFATGWGDPDSSVHGALGFTSHGELLGMAAPRPLLVISGDLDGEAPTPAVAAEVERARAAYRLVGGDAGAALLERTSTPDEHCWCAGKIAAADEFLARVLGGAEAAHAALLPAADPEAAAPAEDPRWPELVRARAAAPVDLRLPFALAMAKARLVAWLGEVAATPSPDLVVPDTVGTPVLIIVVDPAEDPPELAVAAGTSVVRLGAAGLEMTEHADPFVAGVISQHAAHAGVSPLALGVADLRAVIEPLAALGGPVVLVGVGAQSALACAAAAATVPGVTGVVLAGLPAAWDEVLDLAAPDPIAYYASFGLAGTIALVDLVAAAAPARLAWVGAAPPWAAEVAGLESFTEIAPAADWALGAD